MELLTLAILLLLFGVVGTAILFAVALARRSKRQLAANLEPTPGMPSGAPPEWAGQHTPEAKLHRRLSGLARTLAAVPLGDAASIERKVAVEHRVQELEQRLIELAGVPEAARREAVAALELDVIAAEKEVGALAIEPPLR